MKCKKIQQKIAESRTLPFELSQHIEKCTECGTFKRDIDEIRSGLQLKTRESTPAWLRQQTLDSCLDNLLPGQNSLSSRIKTAWRSYWIVLALSLVFVLLMTFGIVDTCMGQNDEQMRQFCYKTYSYRCFCLCLSIRRSSGRLTVSAETRLKLASAEE